jgi:peptide/nickel transport system substrate-binding protein
MRYQTVRKVFLKRRKSAIDLSKQASYNLEKNFIGRFDRLLGVRRFVSTWLLFWLLLAMVTVWQLASLSGYFQTIQPVPGGIYNEGILGTLTNVNPIYATSEVDTSLSHLIFAGLLRYNSQDQLVDCLASSWSVDSAGTVYTVKLKPGLTWQDGKPLTAADVVFTFDTIQNADADSPLYSSWQGISIKAVNSTTVQFTLPNPLASFPYNLTVGIIPKHILGNIPPSDLRAANFNTLSPIGAGPFMWHGIAVSGNTPQNASERIALIPFSDYVLGKPKLSEFIVDAYASQSQLVDAFTAGQLTAVTGIDSVPLQISKMSGVEIHSLILTAGVYVFFKTQNNILSDQAIRKALVLGSDPNIIIDRLGYDTIPVNEPLLVGQLAYNHRYAQVTDQPVQADNLLTKDGWVMAKNGWRYKNHQALVFNLVTTDTPENQLVVGILQKQWRAIGVNLEPIFESPVTYQATLQDHNYDSTLEGISIGTDPDVFVYWDSSQYDPRSSGLNLSEYDNPTVDSALEQGRTRLNPALRVIKYQPFLEAWQQDAPALGLYQPRVIYITKSTVYGLTGKQINSPADRFNGVENWEIVTEGVTDPSKP